MAIPPVRLRKERRVIQTGQILEGRKFHRLAMLGLG